MKRKSAKAILDSKSSWKKNLKQLLFKKDLKKKS